MADNINHMRLKHGLYWILLLTLAACSGGAKPVLSGKNKLLLPEDGMDFKLFQRRSIHLPSQRDSITCYLGDISRGRAEIQVSGGNRYYLHTFIHEGDSLRFQIHATEYVIVCQLLRNKLIGRDYGEFSLKESGRKISSQALENEKIDALIRTIERSDVIFIRNGEEHGSKAAAEHLRRKWENAGDQIKTRDQFIQHLASKSSTTGKAYQIKLKDGTIMTAADWYKTILKD